MRHYRARRENFVPGKKEKVLLRPLLLLVRSLYSSGVVMGMSRLSPTMMQQHVMTRATVLAARLRILVILRTGTWYCGRHSLPSPLSSSTVFVPTRTRQKSRARHIFTSINNERNVERSVGEQPAGSRSLAAKKPREKRIR